MSVGPRPEKFNIVRNDHGRSQNCNFCVSVGKTSFRDHDTPDTIKGFTDSVLVCKMHDCWQKIPAFPFPLIRPSHQAMQATSIAMVRLAIDYENKPFQNAFKRI